MAGSWVPTPFLRAVYPRGLNGCWLIDSVAPDMQGDVQADVQGDVQGEETTDAP